MSDLMIPKWVEPLMRGLRPELRKRLSLRDIDEIYKSVADIIAAERARADALQAHEDQTHAVLGAILGTDDSLEQCAKRLLADRDRLRAAIEQAPHGDGCLYGLRATASMFFHCSCWKRAALEGK